VVYPEGVWYGQVGVKDVEDIMEAHIVGGKPVARLLLSNLMPKADS
jgi:(2Fe-2S) ferredoxin